jgi:serine/threonine protein kinase
MSINREPDAEPIPGYRLVQLLGSGGFGEVWKCEAPGGLFKAIKFVYGNLHSFDVQGARAEQEKKALDRVREVRHPFVLSMDRIEEIDGELVIVMELADSSLHDAFTQCQAAGMLGVPRDTLLRYLRDTAEALDHMNDKHNLQHLDIKPRNLLLVSDRVKVADFGLVKHCSSASGLLGGVTPLYAPPETFTGKVSSYSDQYSLAIVYQELLSGHRPFNGKNARQLAQQHLQEEPELRCLPEPDRAVVARALSKDPNKRFPNCMAFVRALYMAQAQSRPDRAPSDPGLGGPPDARPKSIIDTLENFQLEQLPSGEDAWVSLPEPSDGGEVSHLGMTVAQPQTGSLRPTVVLGLGSFGRRALLELRCRLLDRFGGLDKIPLLRFLYVDTDPDAVKAATHGASEVAFTGGEVYLLGLQAASHYRKRQLEQLSEWLPREKLYSLPRNLKTQGCRALGRLAFCDHYLRLMARLRREVQSASHPDAIYQSVSQTGLALRDNVPRVYVLADATGGSSGVLVDLGYALRRLFHQLRQPESPVTAFVLCGAPDDPATPPAEQANVYATLTELNHFADAAIPFTAQYGSDGPRLVDQGPPYDGAYVLTLANRSPDARQDAVTHLGSYLFHELTTPLGLRLDQSRQQPAAVNCTPFRSFGTYSVWFPRGLLLRLAARTACKRIVEAWQAADEFARDDGWRRRNGSSRSDIDTSAWRSDGDTAEVTAVCAKALADPELRPEALASRLEEVAGKALDATPAEALARLLATLEEQAQQVLAHDDPGNWAKQAARRVYEWLGPGLASKGYGTAGSRMAGDWRKSKLSRALEAAAQEVAEGWSNQLAREAVGLMETPGRRVAEAESGLQRFILASQEAAASLANRLRDQAAHVERAQGQLQSALEACAAGGGFTLFGGRSRRHLRVFLDYLAAFARQCLAEDVACAVKQFWSRLEGFLGERLRDLAFCRQRLRHLQESLEAPALAEEDEVPAALLGESALSPSPPPSTATFWEAISRSATTHVVLPVGESGLEAAADHFVGRLNDEQWAHLDQFLQDRVLTPLGGMHRVCLQGGDILKNLLRPLVEQTAQFLSEHLPITDVAQVLLGEDGVPVARPAAANNGAGRDAFDLQEQIRRCYERSAPVVGGRADPPSPRQTPPPAPEAEGRAFLLIPTSEAGKAYGELAQRTVPELQHVLVAGQSALVFCRESGYIRQDELHQLLRACARAYEESAPVPHVSPHARCDIVDWMPLDP